jgi:hypothetical protein
MEGICMMLSRMGTPQGHVRIPNKLTFYLSLPPRSPLMVSNRVVGYGMTRHSPPNCHKQLSLLSPNQSSNAPYPKKRPPFDISCQKLRWFFDPQRFSQSIDVWTQLCIHCQSLVSLMIAAIAKAWSKMVALHAHRISILDTHLNGQLFFAFRFNRKFTKE